jgi:hypothetical protein
MMIAALVGVLTLATLLHAQELTGVWEGLTPGQQPVRLELAAKDGKLTGTMTVGGEKAPIADGKASKKTFAFSATMGGGTEAFSGEMADAQQIRIWMDDRGPSGAITLKRAGK